MAIELLTHLNDRIFPTGDKKRSSILQIIRESLTELFATSPAIIENDGSKYAYIDFQSREYVRAPNNNEQVIVVNARDFEPEGRLCDSRMINKLFRAGWKQYICYGYKGQRFTGCGFGARTDDVRFDVYDSSGDYMASGIDGMQIHVHGNAQDQLGQIMKRGKFVVHGDVGQTFMYGAKGGEVYIQGNAAGRPLINATGGPRVIIFDDNGNVIDLDMPYPGSNLFSLASGGAIYLRDPDCKTVDDHLNGGVFTELTDEDWNLILPYLEENERQFGISIEDDLLTISGKKLPFNKVYRKVMPKAAVKLEGTKKDG